MAQKLTIACPECGKNSIVNGKCTLCGYELWEADPNLPIPETPQKEPPMPQVIKCPICGKSSVRKGVCRECGYELSDDDEIIEGEAETIEKKQPHPTAKKGFGGLTIFIAVVLGIVAAVWIISKVFYVEITGTITPMK